jgi:hypothetical protein
MTAIEKEQWEDLGWAADVVSGRGTADDNSLAAQHMLQSLACQGATQQIRQASSMTLVHGVAEAA